MGTKSLGAIVAIAIVAMIMFSIAGSMLGEASPKVRIKIAVEKTLPVKVESIETATDAATRQRVLTIAAAPKSGTVTASLAPSIAARAAAILRTGDTIPIEYDALEVRLPGAAPARYERMEIERRAHFESRLPDVAKALAEAMGPGAAPPALHVVAEGNNRYGVGFDARPPAGHDPAALAQVVFRTAPFFVFVELPPEKPGGAPQVIRR